MNFSIIIPVYNEEKRIPKSIDEIFAFFKTTEAVKIEVIFVNDGSKDKTSEVLDSYKGKYEYKVVTYAENQGKGYAVRQGVAAAVGEWLVFFDIDLATPLSEFHHLLSFMQCEDQVVIGSRRLADSAVKKSESWLRTFLGQGFTRLSNILVPGITDFTCGFKCFSQEAAQSIFAKARINRWGFDTELLYIAKLKNLSIRQMPVEWRHDEDSRVKVWRAVIDSAKELCVMKFNQLRGFYN